MTQSSALAAQYESLILSPNTNFDTLERLSRMLSSKYDYLLINELVTAHQLQEALIISKKTKKSVERVLSDRFGIKTDDIGKSLSKYYGYPFKLFDPNIRPPVELLKNLKKSYLLQESTSHQKRFLHKLSS